MVILQCIKYGFTYSRPLCTKSRSLFYTRQYDIFGTNQALCDGFPYPGGLLRCLATKATKARRRPRPRTEEDEKKEKSDKRMKMILYRGLPLTILMIVGAGAAVFALGFVSSMKETAKAVYSKSRLGIYKDTLKKCAQNTEVIRLLGEPVGEVMVNGKPEKVQSTETTTDKVRHIEMQFNIAGSQNTGSVQLQGTQDEEGEFKVVYLCVNVGKDTIIIEDNR